MTAILSVISPELQHTAQQWAYAIAIVTPLVIAGAKKLIPQVPKWLLPCISPLVGIVLGWALNAVTSANLSWVDAGQLGALGVFIREVVDQCVTKQLKATNAT
jgi:MFS superfamily sulfate permease-like transporter